MRKHLNLIFSLLILTSVLVLPFFVFAQSATTDSDSMLGRLETVAGGGGYNTGETGGLMIVVGTIIQAALGLLGAIFIILVVIAGYGWMTAAGNEEKIKKAVTKIKQAIIGLVITLSSWAIWSFIFNNFIKK